MRNPSSTQAAVGLLAAQSDAIGRLAQDSGGFAAVVAAYESKDADAFRWVLDRLDLFPQCELICEWLRIKLCVLRCLEVCGPAQPEAELPDLPSFARAIVHLAAHEKLLRRVVDAVACGDADDYHAALEELGLQAYCHLLCRWICSVIYHRVCEVVCSPRPVLLTDTATDVRAIARVLERVIDHGKLLDTVGRAGFEWDCLEVRAAIGEAGFLGDCEIICLIFCAWRTAWVCRELCERPSPVIGGAYAIEEARNFALAIRGLATQPRALADLVGAVENRDAKAYRTLVDRYGLGEYCLQLCSWLGSIVCLEFCICVCPNPQSQDPEWTNIGYILVTSDINAAGKTVVSRSGAGGVNYAFYSSLQLKGFCPATSPVAPGQPMMYRFGYSIGAGPQQFIVDGMLNPNPFQVANQPLQSWPKIDPATLLATGTTAMTGGAVFVCNRSDVPLPAAMVTTSPTVLAPPTIGQPWYPPAVYVWPDPITGWVDVYSNILGGAFDAFMDFDTTHVVPSANPDTTFPPAQIGAVPIPSVAQLNGANVTLTFEATRTTMAVSPDYVQSPVLIRVNNAVELNQLTFEQFLTGPLGCCTPINNELSVLFSVDHEEIGAGDWSLAITSCPTNSSAPGDITPAASGALVTLTSRGGSGTILEDTSTWNLCSYTATLSTTPQLTDGVNNRSAWQDSVTFCICGH